MSLDRADSALARAGSGEGPEGGAEGSALKASWRRRRMSWLAGSFPADTASQ